MELGSVVNGEDVELTMASWHEKGAERGNSSKTPGAARCKRTPGIMRCACPFLLCTIEAGDWWPGGVETAPSEQFPGFVTPPK